MPVHRRLYRPEIYTTLARISKKWPKLSYPRFCIQAENEMNPDRLNDPICKFSIVESVRGWLSAKPVRSIVRQIEDLRLYVDSLGRPDPYALRWCNNARRRWNEDVLNETRNIYRITYTVLESRRNSETVEVYYDFLETLRGRRSVGQLEEHLDNGIAGLQETRERIQRSADTRAVDRRIVETLEENRVIQGI